MADFKIWMNGRPVLQAEAVLPVNSAAVFYATKVFEGLRAYWHERDGELYGFRLADHFARLREGRLCTPTTSNDILESITRTTLIEDVAPDVVGMDVVEREIERTELYTADEAFLCGSGYEITPVTSVDRFPVGRGEVGPVTRAIANGYMNLVRGVDSRHPEWRTATDKPVRPSVERRSPG